MSFVQFRKSAHRVKSYVLYTADKPASYDALVDGVVRGALAGRVAGQYSRDAYYVVTLDGVQVDRVSGLKQAKRAFELALAKSNLSKSPSPITDLVNA